MQNNYHITWHSEQLDFQNDFATATLGDVIDDFMTALLDSSQGSSKLAVEEQDLFISIKWDSYWTSGMKEQAVIPNNAHCVAKFLNDFARGLDFDDEISITPLTQPACVQSTTFAW